MRFSEYLLRKNLQHIILHVTNRCNFRCKHCFVDFTPADDLPIERIRTLSQEVGPLFWMDIGGGEPFLRRDLAEIVSLFDTKVVTIPSNGSLADRMLPQLAEMKKTTDAEVVLSLSLDGLKDTHNSIRGKKDSWDQVWSMFEEVRQLGGISVKINTVINNENFDEIIPLMEQVRHEGADFHSVFLVRGETLSDEINLPPIQDLRQLGPEIFKILGTYDYGRTHFSTHILRNYHRYLWNISLRTLEEKTQVIPCLAGKAHMVVMGNGKVSSCEMLAPIGDLKTQSWREIQDSDAFKKQLKSIENKECHCTHNCAMFDSIFFNPKNLPNLIKPVAV